MTNPFLFAILFCLAAPAAKCQRSEKYFDYQWHPTDAKHARFYRLVEKTDSGWHRRDYFMHSLTLMMEGLYEDSSFQIPSGYFLAFHPSRHLASVGAYLHGQRQGLWLQYFSDGSLFDSTVYESGRPLGARVSWYRSGYMCDSGNYRRDGSGVYFAWFDNGQPSHEGRYGPAHRKFGKWKYFYRSGGISAEEVYDEQGRLLNRHYFDEKGKPITDTTDVERKASFPGGATAWASYLSSALRIPDEYKATNGDEATVVVTAAIGEDGRVLDAEVEVPYYPDFDRIALEAVRRSPNWIPAMDHHRKVQGFIREPVSFYQPGK